MRTTRLWLTAAAAVAVVAVGGASQRSHAQGDVTSCPVVPRSEWGARPPVIGPLNMTLPVPYVVIHHSYIPRACTTREACLKAMKSMQHMHQIVNKWNDIGYNFAVGSDAEVYEGRGWDVVGAHAPKYNFMSIGVCFIGDYRAQAPSTPMLEAAQRLILCGIARGSIQDNYTLVGHRQVRETECPGGALFREIQGWLHWKPIRDIQPRVPPAHKPSHVATPGNNTGDELRPGTAPSLSTPDKSAHDIDKPAHSLNTTDQSQLDAGNSLNTTDQSIYNTNITSMATAVDSTNDTTDLSNANNQNTSPLPNRSTHILIINTSNVSTFSDTSRYSPDVTTSNTPETSDSSTDTSTQSNNQTDSLPDITGDMPGSIPTSLGGLYTVTQADDTGIELNTDTPPHTSIPPSRTLPIPSKTEAASTVSSTHDISSNTSSEIMNNTVDVPDSEDTSK